MKQISFLLLFLFLGTGMQSLNAQNNVIKMNLLSFTTSTLSLDYERKIGPRITADVRVNYFYAGNVISRVFNTIDVIADQAEGDDFRYTSSIDDFRGFFITPGFRFYPKEAFKGFYLEPNIRYGRYSLKAEYEFEDEIDPMVTYVEQAPVVMRLLGGGLNLGVQKVFDNNLAIDFFLGLGFSNINLTVESQDDSNLTETQLIDIKEDIDIAISAGTTASAGFFEDLFLKNLSASVEDNKVKGGFEGMPWPIARIGFSLGYAF